MATAHSTSIPEARALAQRCWGRCRDSSSSFKLLTTSVRKLRNTLEEVEDIYDASRTLGPDDLRLLRTVAEASETLHRLDAALQIHLTSDDVDTTESDVADLKTSVDATTNELSLAFEAVTTGEIHMQLDTTFFAGTSSQGVSSSSNTAGSSHERESSCTSSAWSAGQGGDVDHVDPSSERTRDESKPRASDEKEVRDFGKAHLQSLAPDSSAADERKPSPDWRSPFASPDPLSISIEAASSLIMSADDDSFGRPTRSRSGTGSTIFATETQAARNADVSDLQALSKPAEDNSLDNEVVDVESHEESPLGATSNADRYEPGRGRFSGATHLSPASAAAEFAISRSRTASLASVTGAELEPDAATRSGRTDESNIDQGKEGVQRSFGGELDKKPDRSSENGLGIDALQNELNTLIATSLGDTTPQSDDDEPTTALPVLASPTVTQQSPGASPPMPMRRPPPPPPAPRRRKTSKARARASSYRIVNASPVDSQSSDEEDLYSVSRSASPTKTSDQPGDSGHTVQVRVADATRSPVPLPKLENDNEARSPPLGTSESASIQKGNEEPAQVDDMKAAYSKSPAVYLSPASRHDNPTDSLDAEEKPPPLPKRPARYKTFMRDHEKAHGLPSSSVRSRAGTAPEVRPPTATEKELMLEPGLEVGSKTGSGVGLEVLDGSRPLRERVSVDAALDVQTHNNGNDTVAEWYAPGSGNTSLTELERERINHVLHFWNMAAWDQAEAYLTDYLAALTEEESLARARRVRHLLGVCASFKGEWDRAIPLFLSTLRRPIRDISEIDDGDSAAAYWLGDAYTLLNRRTEALLAYCIAERSSLFHNEETPGLSTLIGLEQEAVQFGASKADLMARWAQEAVNRPASYEPTSILDPNVITTTAAKMLFENEPRKQRRGASDLVRDGPFQLDQNKSRSNSFFHLTRATSVGAYYRMRLNGLHFEPNSTWPLMYDPLFSIANVQRGRLLAYECDMLDVFSTNGAAKVAKSSSVGLTQMNSFTSNDLSWLIKTIRECLNVFGMDFSEVVNVQGTWFVVRYSFMLSKIATTYYFSISLFKQALRGGYGVDICPDGICSSRIIRTTYDYDKGVYHAESKRMRKMIREYLEDAAKQKPKLGRRASSLVEEGLASQMAPPPMATRPSYGANP